MGTHEEEDLLGEALICAIGKPRLNPEFDDEVPLSFFHQEGLDQRVKTELAESSNLRLLRQSLAEARSGQLSLDDYRMNVADVLEVARSGRELLGTSLFTAIPAEIGGLVNESGRLYEQFHLGCLQMMEYEGDDLGPALEGYARVEQALRGLDRLEDLVRQRIEDEEAAA
ncbi:MAG: hypothetical protein HY319_25985 [Armatimonadetes bacterium]|nr:hypothetical protein [Armatimonadota bacterium]